MAEERLKILVVDDSALYCQLLRNVLREVPGVEVVGAAKSGPQALDMAGELDPDLMTLDVRMPGGDGLMVLRELRKRRSRTRAIMVSSFTATGAQVTTDALMEGAFDFIQKPGGADAAANRRVLLESLTEKIAIFRASRKGETQRNVAPAASPIRRAPARTERFIKGCQAVLIGTSTGGPVALREVLTQLPADLPVPVLIVQHMPAEYTHSLAERLNEISPLEVVEACDGMQLEPGWAFLAPGGRHMKIVRRGNRTRIQITDDPPENSCRPSVDYLFRSALDTLGGDVVAVVMTGMGRDGTEGCRGLKQRGAYVVAQHPDGCVVFGMPKSVIEEQLADEVVPLHQIAAAVLRQVVRGTGNGPTS
ncbi:MAG TPA: chemotaxis response regulator protein-glutamate methylesterase [Planctomycetaceae bacterium]|nr:chemotaxis response regulator protein-glutamate methylesterase [Planctomycetaceae bacterium]